MESRKEGRTENANKELNDIRVGINSRVRNVIGYCNSILSEKKVRDLHFSAVGGAIGKLVDTVEVLKIVNPGFYQINKIATVSYQTVDSQGRIINQKIYPKLEIILTLDEPKERGEGYQPAIKEKERVILLELLNRSKPIRKEGERMPGEYRQDRGNFASRGRRGFRGGQKGSFRGFNQRDRFGSRDETRPRGGFSRGGRRGSINGPRERRNY